MKTRVVAPASTANLGPAFDSAARRARSLERGGDRGDVEHSPSRSTAKAPTSCRATRAICRCARSRSSRRSTGYRFSFVNRIPLERGLGSSAAAIALGVVAGSSVAGTDATPERAAASAPSSSKGTPTISRLRCSAASVSPGVGRRGSRRRGSPRTALASLARRSRRAARTRRARATGCPRPCRTRTRPRTPATRPCSARRSPPATPASSATRSTTVCTSSTALDAAPLLRVLQASPPAGALGVTLSGSGPSVVVWAAPERADDVAAELGQLSPRRHQGAPAPSRPGRSEARMSPYGSTHPAKRNSAALTDGVDRAPARAMLKGAGFTDADLAKPLIGVATTWIETMPCNLNHRVLARYVKQGIRDAGGTPLEFNTIAVSDGVTMGAAGMRASLVSREVIADSIELVTRGHHFDGLVCIVGCDKTIPAAVMALARLDIPGLVFYGGSIAAGRYRGKDVTIQDVFEAVGAHAAGTISEGEVHALESVACPGRGRLRRALHREHDGDGARLPRRQRARTERSARDASGQAAGRGRRRRARDEARARGHAPVAGADARGVRERDLGDRRDRRLDERRPAPAGDRRRGRRRALDRRLRHGLGAHADRRRHQARRPLRRDRPLQGRRRRARRTRARARRARPRGRDAASTAARFARSPTARTSAPAGRRRLVGQPAQGDGRPRDPARATSRRTAAS